MEITDIRISLRNEERLKAFANITFNNVFIVRGLKVINGKKGYFVAMPSRRRPDGTYQDIAHPLNTQMRQYIESKVLDSYYEELKREAAKEEVDE